MYATNQFRKGLKIEVDGTPFEIVDFQHVSPGKGSAFVRTKLKNLLTRNQTEKTFKSGDVVPRANTDEKEMQFLYNDGSGYHVMDMKTYEQVALTEEIFGDRVGYLKENLVLRVLFYNDRAIAVELPNFIEVAVAETDPAFKGDTVSGSGKPAKIETGATVTVPYHIKEGDIIKVDTRDGKYSEKVSK